MKKETTYKIMEMHPSRWLPTLPMVTHFSKVSNHAQPLLALGLLPMLPTLPIHCLYMYVLHNVYSKLSNSVTK